MIINEKIRDMSLDAYNRDTVITGRHIYLLILQQLSITDENGSCCAILQMHGFKWLGDSPLQMAQFTIIWKRIDRNCTNDGIVFPERAKDIYIVRCCV